jgi:predicted XRE-type DNA-binding protein
MTTKPSHITKGDVLDDLGFTRAEASALKIKADLLDSILREIEKRGYTQRQLVDLLDEYQPSDSNLLQGKIAKVSIEKLLYYSARLNLQVSLSTAPRAISRSAAKPPVPHAGRKLAAATIGGSSWHLKPPYMIQPSISTPPVALPPISVPLSRTATPL